MNALCPPRRAPRAARQRGQAMLLTVLLLGVGVSAVIYNFTTPARQSVERDRITASALAQAKEALIGYAASDANRPGSLPCPDLLTDNPGFNNIPNDGAADQLVGQDCPSYVGRLPWRTLGLPDLRDGSGERLWYAVSRGFARNPVCGAACPLNSDTAGELTVNGIAPAGQVIAIVFAAGTVVDAQDRSSATNSPCGTLGSIANDRCPANYLDGENGNGLPPVDNIFLTATGSATFNDQALPITSDQLFQVVNMRVTRELRAALTAYRTAVGNYPRANPYGAANFNCNDNTYVGRLPSTLITCHTRTQLGWGGGVPEWTGAMPAWFATNQWSSVTHYAVAQPCGLSFSLGFLAFIDLDALVATVLRPFCDGTGGPITDPLKTVLEGLGLVVDNLLTVNLDAGAASATAVLFVSGRAKTDLLPPQPTPCTSVNPCRLEAPNTITGPNYTKPSRFPDSNDRMGVICAPVTSCNAIP